MKVCICIFLSFGHLTFINQFSKKLHRLASTASDRKGTNIQHEFSRFCQKKFFSKHQNKCFQSSDYWFQEPGWLRSNFPGLTNLCSLIDLSGLCNVTSLISLYSSISSKNFLVLMVWSSLAPKWPILAICRMDQQKSNFF